MFTLGRNYQCHARFRIVLNLCGAHEKKMSKVQNIRVLGATFSQGKPWDLENTMQLGIEGSCCCKNTTSRDETYDICHLLSTCKDPILDLDPWTSILTSLPLPMKSDMIPSHTDGLFHWNHLRHQEASTPWSLRRDSQATCMLAWELNGTHDFCKGKKINIVQKGWN